eukprot:1065783-Pleurochrysis_carterae.AAC.1
MQAAWVCGCCAYDSLLAVQSEANCPISPRCPPLQWDESPHHYSCQKQQKQVRQQAQTSGCDGNQKSTDINPRLKTLQI